jgi:hypothetical protein
VIDAPAPVPTQTPPDLLARRPTDRRVGPMSNHFPDRRVTDRREQALSSERRNADRRQLVVQGYFPERRRGDRRFLAEA